MIPTKRYSDHIQCFSWMEIIPASRAVFTRKLSPEVSLNCYNKVGVYDGENNDLSSQFPKTSEMIKNVSIIMGMVP
jgi:hypothetical protein